MPALFISLGVQTMSTCGMPKGDTTECVVQWFDICEVTGSSPFRSTSTFFHFIFAVYCIKTSQANKCRNCDDCAVVRLLHSLRGCIGSNPVPLFCFFFPLTFWWIIVCGRNWAEPKTTLEWAKNVDRGRKCAQPTKMLDWAKIYLSNEKVYV